MNYFICMAKRIAKKASVKKTTEKYPRLTLRLDPDLLGKVEKRAELEYTTVSSLIKRALVHYLDTFPAPKVRDN